MGTYPYRGTDYPTEDARIEVVRADVNEKRKALKMGCGKLGDLVGRSGTQVDRVLTGVSKGYDLLGEAAAKLGLDDYWLNERGPTAAEKAEEIIKIVLSARNGTTSDAELARVIVIILTDGDLLRRE